MALLRSIMEFALCILLIFLSSGAPLLKLCIHRQLIFNTFRTQHNLHLAKKGARLLEVGYIQIENAMILRKHHRFCGIVVLFENVNLHYDKNHLLRMTYILFKVANILKQKIDYIWTKRCEMQYQETQKTAKTMNKTVRKATQLDSR